MPHAHKHWSRQKRAQKAAEEQARIAREQAKPPNQGRGRLDEIFAHDPCCHRWLQIVAELRNKYAAQPA